MSEAAPPPAARTLLVADAPLSIVAVLFRRLSPDFGHRVLHENVLGADLDHVFGVGWNGDHSTSLGTIQLALQTLLDVCYVLPELRERNLVHFKVFAVRFLVFLGHIVLNEGLWCEG